MSMTFFLRIVWERKQRRKERKKEAKKERNEEIPPLFELFITKLGLFFFFDSCIYLIFAILLLYIPLF